MKEKLSGKDGFLTLESNRRHLWGGNLYKKKTRKYEKKEKKTRSRQKENDQENDQEKKKILD